MSWQKVVEEWRLRFNLGRPDAEALTSKEARAEADRLIAMLRREVKARRVVVPELGTFEVHKLKARTMPGGAKAGATWHVRFRAGLKSRGQL